MTEIRDPKTDSLLTPQNNADKLNLIGAQKRSGFVATLLTLTAFGHAKARRDG